MEKIVYKTDTGIAVITPTHGVILTMKDIPRILPADKQELWDTGKMSLQEYTKYPNVEYKIIDESELPADRIFRNAWNYDLKEDLAKSKEIWKEKLRVEREPLLRELDIEQINAIADGTDITAIIAAKQELRDITFLVDAAKTIDEIKMITIETAKESIK